MRSKRRNNISNLAINKAHEPVDRGIALRQYARYLFAQENLEEGRRRFLEAVDCFDGDSDLSRSYRGNSYERWAHREADWGKWDDADEKLRMALENFGRLANPTRRRNETERVKKLREEFARRKIDEPGRDNIKTTGPSAVPDAIVASIAEKQVIIPKSE